MLTHAERFRHMMQEWNLTQEEMGNLCGLKRGTVGTIVNSKTVPDVEALAKLRQAKPDLNPDWLLLGTGPMLRDGKVLTPVVVEERTPTKAIELSQDEHRRELVATAENVLLRQLLVSKDDMITVLKAELGKPNDSTDAADYSDFEPAPKGPASGVTLPLPRLRVEGLRRYSE